MKTIYPFIQNELFGFSDEQGNIVIPAKYTHIYRPCIHETDGYSTRRGNALWGVVCNNLHGLIDNSGNVKLDCCMESQYGRNIFESHYDRILIKKDGKYGFLDNEGNEVIACYYTRTSSNFCYGYTIVETDNKTNKVIDSQGNVLFESYSVKDYLSGDKVLFSCTTETGEQYVVDQSGNEIIAKGQHQVHVKEGIIRLQEKVDGKVSYDNPAYSFFSWDGKKISDYGQYSDVTITSDGCYRVESEKKCGLLDKDLNVLIPCHYQSFECLLNKYFKVKDADGKWGVIYAGGEEVLSCGYKSIDLWMPKNYVDGLVEVDLHGRCDKAILVQTTDMEGFKRNVNLEGTEFAPADISLYWLNGKILNRDDIKKGKNLDIDYASDFLKAIWRKPEVCTGLYSVTDGWGGGVLYDSNGNILLSDEKGFNFHSCDNRAAVSIKGKGATIYDEKGGQVATINCDRIFTGHLNSKSFITIIKDNLYGLADWDGKVLIKCLYDSVMVNDHLNLVRVKKDGLYGVFNIKGKELLPCEYESLTFPLYDYLGIGVDLILLEGADKYAFATTDLKHVSQLVYKEALKGEGCFAAYEVNGFWAKRSRLVCVESKHLYELECGALLQKEYSITRTKDVPQSMQYYFCDLTLAAKCIDGKKFKKGLIDKNKNVVLDFVYDAIGPWNVIENNALHALVKNGTKYGIINAQFKEVVPCQYDKKKSLDDLPASFAAALDGVINGKEKI